MLLFYVNYLLYKKNIYKIRVFCSGNFAKSPQVVGDFQNPSGNPPDPRAFAPDSVRHFTSHSGLRTNPGPGGMPPRFSKSPLGFMRSVRRVSPKNLNFLNNFPDINIEAFMNAGLVLRQKLCYSG